MINKDFFFKGFKSILAPDSPALALGCCFIAIGALLKNLGFNIQESIFSTMLTYALPGSLVMAESLLVGASLLNIFLAVWFVNARLYPMAVSLFPLMIHKSQPKWKYYFSCHFIAVSAWLIMKSNYKSIEKKHRIDFWIGIGCATWTTAVIGTFIGFYASDYLDKNMMMGLSNFKSNLFFMHDGRCNENYSNYSCSNFRLGIRANLLLSISRVVNFIGRTCWWDNCLFYRRTKCQLVYFLQS